MNRVGARDESFEGSIGPDEATEGDEQLDRPPRTVDIRMSSVLIRRVLIVLACLSLLQPAFIGWGSFVRSPPIGLGSVVITIGALTGIVVAVSARTRRVVEFLDWLVLGLALGALALWTASILQTNSAYSTDEAALLQGASQSLLHGIDPYGVNLFSYIIKFQVPIQYATYLVNGGIVTGYGYPALPILYLVPFIWLTHGIQAEPIAMVVAMGTGMIASWMLLPKQVRAIAIIVVVGLPILFGYAVSGATGLLIWPLVITFWRWNEIGDSGILGRRGYTSAIALGLAASATQLTWFVVPFLLVGIWEVRRRKSNSLDAVGLIIRYLVLVVGVFLVINLPFIIWNPHSFLTVVGFLGAQSLIPYGQGLISLPIFLGLGGGNLAFYGYAAMATYAALLVTYLSYFDRMWKLTPMLASVPFFLSTRSLAEYWMAPVLVWIMGILAPIDIPHATMRRSNKRGLALIVFLPAFLLVSLGLISKPPLQLHIKQVWTNGQLQSVWRVALSVTNTSDAVVYPHYAADSSGQVTSFWSVDSGPTELEPHRTATVVVSATNSASMPAVTSSFVMEAVSASPASVMISNTSMAYPYRTSISYNYADGSLPLGKRIILDVALVKSYGTTAQIQGIKVALGQIIYGSHALLPGMASINNSQPGIRVAYALTDGSGIARFKVSAEEDQGAPIYFQAWVAPKSGVQFGYSGVIALRWSRR